MSVGMAERGVGWIHLCTSTLCTVPVPITTLPMEWHEIYAKWWGRHPL